jgi:hypothetical protein
MRPAGEIFNGFTGTWSIHGYFMTTQGKRLYYSVKERNRETEEENWNPRQRHGRSRPRIATGSETGPKNSDSDQHPFGRLGEWPGGKEKTDRREAPMNSAAVPRRNYCTNPPDKTIESEMQFPILAE